MRTNCSLDVPLEGECHEVPLLEYGSYFIEVSRVEKRRSSVDLEDLPPQSMTIGREMCFGGINKANETSGETYWLPK